MSFRKAAKNAAMVLAHYMLNEGSMLICYSHNKRKVGMKVQQYYFSGIFLFVERMALMGSDGLLKSCT